MANERINFIGLGELLWDCFPNHRLPGGAPANVAYHAQQLGLCSATVTRVGSDPLGDDICDFLKLNGLGTELLQHDPIHGTGTVTVLPLAEGTKYTFLEDSAWDFIEPNSELLSAMATAQAVCFGTLAQRGKISRSTIHKCLATVAEHCLVVYDVNLRPPFYERSWIEKSLQRAKIVKLNDEELQTLAAMFSVRVSQEADFAKYLFQQYPLLELVCVTRGANGCLGVSREGEIVEQPGLPVEVEPGVTADTVGAGDAFTATLIRARLAHLPLARSLQIANQVGALVASCAGAMPRYHGKLAELKNEFSAA